MVPHLATRKTHQRLWEFSFATPKRLLQQYLPGTDIRIPQSELANRPADPLSDDRKDAHLGIHFHLGAIGDSRGNVFIKPSEH